MCARCSGGHSSRQVRIARICCNERQTSTPGDVSVVFVESRKFNVVLGVPVKLVDAAAAARAGARAGQQHACGGAQITGSHAVARQFELQAGLCTDICLVCRVTLSDRRIDTKRNRKMEKSPEKS